jgi:ferric-dicitrate binding protein FerR (iron transport regulator)
MEDVQHAAARALSRRMAAHRFAGHEVGATHADHKVPDTTPEQSWEHVMHALHGEQHSSKALAEQAAMSRHEAAEHITSLTRGAPPWKPILFGVTVIAALIGIALWFNYLGRDSRLATAVNATDARVIASLPSQMGNVVLDDGTKVRIAPETKLSIPKAFGPDLRAVKVEGVAHFEVAPGQKTDLQVHTQNAVVTAKGTAFTVSSYPEDNSTTIVVSEGSVEVRKIGSKERQPLAAGAGLVFAGTASGRPASAGEREQADGWRTGMLVVDNGNLRDVLTQMKRWYGTDILLPDTMLRVRKVSVRASLDSVMQAIRGVEQSSGLEFGYIGPNKVFREPAGKAPAAKGKETKKK